MGAQKLESKGFIIIVTLKRIKKDNKVYATKDEFRGLGYLAHGDASTVDVTSDLKCIHNGGDGGEVSQWHVSPYIKKYVHTHIPGLEQRIQLFLLVYLHN